MIHNGIGFDLQYNIYIYFLLQLKLDNNDNILKIINFLFLDLEDLIQINVNLCQFLDLVMNSHKYIVYYLYLIHSNLLRIIFPLIFFSLLLLPFYLCHNKSYYIYFFLKLNFLLYFLFCFDPLIKEFYNYLHYYYSYIYLFVAKIDLESNVHH